MKYRIAIVEDDELISNMIAINLSRNNYLVDRFTDAESLAKDITNNPFDLLILDILLPGISGLELVKNLRKAQSRVPILMISVKEDIKSKLSALHSGADDYLVKPFNMDELIARVQALIRRSQKKIPDTSENILHINNYKINLFTRECESNQGLVVLSEKEMRLLEYFVNNADTPLSRSDILEEVWGMDTDPTPRTIDNFIVKFRKLFEENPAKPHHFITIRKKGYFFKS